MKLITNLKHRRNQLILLPVVGEVKFDENLAIEVSNEDAAQLLELDESLSVELKEDDGIPQGQMQEIGEVSDEDEKDNAKQIRLMKKEELVELAIAADCPREEWEALNKTDLIKYLTEKTK